MDLSQITEELLFLNDNHGRLRTSADQYYRILSQTTGISDESSFYEDEIETYLADGKAISPKNAARCVLDYRRTSLFLRGIYAAINEAQKRFPGKKIEILYAGCGPFAALAVPFCLKFSSEEICFTLIDIHRRSLDSAAKIFQKYGFENFISDYIQSDAAFFRTGNDKKFHIIVTETMQKTLEKEPQVAITLNLADQLYENGIFIPQKITVEACLANFQKEFVFDSDKQPERERIKLGKIFELTSESFAEKENLFSPKTLEIPAHPLSLSSFMLLTKIEIFDSFKLDDYNSGLTYPTILHEIGELKAGQKIRFQYITGKNPHFEFRLIQAS